MGTFPRRRRLFASDKPGGAQVRSATSVKAGAIASRQGGCARQLLRDVAPA